MEKWVESLRNQAEHALKQGEVREVIFSGATYQIDVYDPEMDEHYWPFLQFNDQGRVKDAFCSCNLENAKCYHLAAAYLRVVDSSGLPLHLRFEKSFWYHLCRLCADHSGYEERFLQKIARGHYLYHNEVFFQLQTKTEQGALHLTKLIENRAKETPENSIKFSNLSQKEISHWREGRPSPALRYALSLWSDLAKWMMDHHQEGKVFFKDDQEGFPTQITIDFPFLSAYVEIKKTELPRLIGYLDAVNSNLKLFASAEEQITAIAFHPEEPAFYLKHESLKLSDQPEQKITIGEWSYLPKVGFYPIKGQPLLHRQRIGKEDIPEFLNRYSNQIAPFIPVHQRRQSLRYFIYFDEEWNWHFVAYLFEKGDLQRLNSLFLGEWIFIQTKGFYQLEKSFFNQLSVTLSPHQVSDFVNNHRIWLNSQEGYQTHLASIESHLLYSIGEDKTLRFYSKADTLVKGAKDFGDWIFYRGLGFFSKKHARLGHIVRSGIEVKAHEISAFIKANREELENIPHFFTPLCPLASRCLEVILHPPMSIHVKPVHTLLPPFQESDMYLFEDFIYLKGEGFCPLPTEMRLPNRYTKPQTISHSNLNEFIENDLPLLKHHISYQNNGLEIPHQTTLFLRDLRRVSGGKLKAQLFYRTEFGQVAVTDLLEAVQHKRRYCFTEAGLIDLHAPPFQWMRQQKGMFFSETKTLELSTLDFIRLDTVHGLLGPPADASTADITHALLKEMREFSSHEIPDTTGLKSELRLYQQTGLHWLWFLYTNDLSGLLCDDMGLGKTHQAMALIAAALNQKEGKKKRFLVVCPTSVIYHWQDKLEMFLPHLKVHTFHGAKRTLRKIPHKGVVLTSYGILRIEQKRLEAIPFELAIFDEVQVAKNPHSRIHEALKKINAQMRVGLTGTPIENSLRELKSLFDIVLPGYMPSEARYRELFIQPIERDHNEEKKALLIQMVKPFMLRRKKTEVLTELPEKSEDKSYCNLSKEQIILYTQTLAQSQEMLVSQLHDQAAPINYIHIFSLLSRLKQVCNHPALLYKDPKNFKNHRSGKWDLFVELLDEAQESHQKVVIFSQYLHMLDIFAYYLKERGWGFAQIRGETIDRRNELKRFQEDPNCAVFIGSLQAAGLGIDLTAASVVIMYDRWWNAARENQAIDRVHRIGQKWGVQVYKLITKNTIEEKIDRMIMRKGRLLEEIVLSDDQTVIKKFTRAELIDLLSFPEDDIAD